MEFALGEVERLTKFTSNPIIIVGLVIEGISYNEYSELVNIKGRKDHDFYGNYVSYLGGFCSLASVKCLNF